MSRLTNEETGVEWGGHLPGVTGAAESTVGPETPVSPPAPPREVLGCGESWRQGCNTGMRDPGVTGCRVGFWLRAEGRAGPLEVGGAALGDLLRRAGLVSARPSGCSAAGVRRPRWRGRVGFPSRGSKGSRPLLSTPGPPGGGGRAAGHFPARGLSASVRGQHPPASFVFLRWALLAPGGGWPAVAGRPRLHSALLP